MNYAEALEALHERHAPTVDFKEEVDQEMLSKALGFDNADEGQGDATAKPERGEPGPGESIPDEGMEEETVEEEVVEEDRGKPAAGDGESLERMPKANPKQNPKKPPLDQQDGAKEDAYPDPASKPELPGEDAFLSVDMDKKYSVLKRAKARLQGLKTEFQMQDNPVDKRRVYKMIIRQMIKLSDMM